ncbi:hypothetical protein AVEN_252789-1 [Araneus ventricosus]|uniref:Reverse transcriptase zinc-binding domain-containing protein n=1 Tax=Araneus ventricosus TaxID=182803 RepID=A0A4Y2CK81_ARAVE|nr:hypothetical protein AVEN_252789-1 [Araneus ventricosus]
MKEPITLRRKPLKNKKSIFIFCKTKQQRKTEVRKKIRQNWQILWDHSSKGKQIKKLLDKVDEKRVLGDFYFNQIITGHGAFQIYQNRFVGKSPWCFCEKDEGTVEYAILKCDAWQDIRDSYLKKNSSSVKELLQDSQSRKGMGIDI